MSLPMRRQQEDEISSLRWCSEFEWLHKADAANNLFARTVKSALFLQIFSVITDLAGSV